MSVRLAALVAVLAVSGCTWETRPDGDSPRHLDAARPHPTVSPDPVAEEITPETVTTGAVAAEPAPATAPIEPVAPEPTTPTP
jgi:hypothetical protein